MGSFKLDDLVSSSDRQKVMDSKNPPKFEKGFEEEVTDDGLNMFDDFDSVFGGKYDSMSASDIAKNAMGFDKPASASDTTQQQGQPGMFGSSPFGGTGLANFGNNLNTQQQQQMPPKKPDKMDIAIDASIEAVENSGKVMFDMFKSISNRTADDWGLYATKMMFTGGIGAGVSLLLSILGAFGNINIIKLTGIPGDFLVASMIVGAVGGLTLSISARYILEAKKYESVKIDNIPDIKNTSNISNEEVESKYSSILDEIDWGNLGSDDEEYDDDIEEVGSHRDAGAFTSAFDNIMSKYEEETKPVDFDSMADNVGANLGFITRETLVRTFKPYLALNTIGFEMRQELSTVSSQFVDMETLIKKAIGMACGIDDVDKVDTYVENITETYFSYEVKAKRIKGLNKLETIDSEIERFFSHPDSGELVSSETTIEGNNYKIIISKGETAVVTLGDTFRLSEIEDFFLNEKNKLPLVVGIDRKGKVITADAKHFDSMLVAGKPRSGKSWFVFTILMCIAMFNKPTDVQMLIIDPKESNLFNTMGLMPHVCGVHNDKNILKVLQDVIELEAPRRKKLLKDHRCDDIWDFREKTGIELPVLYVVIDEVMSVIANLGPLEKDFTEQLKIILTQFPSLGIRLLIVPHRAQGVIDKSVRLNLSFAAAVRAGADVVKETLEVPKWTKDLLNQGDMAVKMSGHLGVIQSRGAAITTSDRDNAKFVLNAAKAFYKMGVDVPDMSTIGEGYNRDEDEIENILYGDRNGAKLVQFDSTSFDNVDDIDLDAISREEI